MPRSTSRPLLAVLAASAALVVAPTAADAAPMAFGFEDFAGCPQQESVTACQTLTYEDGSVGLGALTIPVDATVELSGGVDDTGPSTRLLSDAGSVLRPTAFSLPAGVAGLSGATVVPELVGDPEQTEGGFRWPLRFGLQGAGLPEGCGIGSAAEPVVVNLTNGTTTPPAGTQPLTGAEGSPGIDVVRSVIKLDDARYVDNTYAVPATSGCGDAGAAIDAAAGLPAAPGASAFVVDDADSRFAIDVTRVFAS